MRVNVTERDTGNAVYTGDLRYFCDQNSLDFETFKEFVAARGWAEFGGGSIPKYRIELAPTIPGHPLPPHDLAEAPFRDDRDMSDYIEEMVRMLDDIYDTGNMRLAWMIRQYRRLLRGYVTEDWAVLLETGNEIQTEYELQRRERWSTR